MNATRCLLLLLFARAACAQTPAPTSTGAGAAPTRIHLTEQTVLTDAQGQRLAPAVWRQMLATDEYRLIPAPGSSADKPAYQVVPRTKAAAPLAAIEPSPFFTTGQRLAPFAVRDMTGRAYSSKDLVGKIVVLNFWFIGCRPCREEIPALNQLVARNAQRTDIVFLAIGLDERAALEEFVRQQPYAYALVADGRSIAARYGINSFPTSVVVNRQGQVVFHAQVHPNMATYLQQAIDQLN